MSLSPPSREALRLGAPAPFRTGRNWTKADLFVWMDGDDRLAVKDYAPRPFWVRNSLGRFLVGRECAAYARLGGTRGIPAFAGRIDAVAFALGYVEGKELSRCSRGEVPPAFFGRLLDLLATVHRAGVAHGDLHHRDVLLDAAGLPVLVDFSTSIVIDEKAGPIRRALFRVACASDRRAALKLKRRYDPGSLNEVERRILERPPLWYRMGKMLRGWVRPSARKREPPDR